MPEISRFFGVVIQMYREVGARHHRPHLHATYQSYRASYSIGDPVECLAGSLPRKKNNLVVAWIEIHQDELLDNWNQLAAGQRITKLPPLR